MNTKLTNAAEPLTTAEINYLNEKKGWATIYVLMYFSVLIFGYAMYFTKSIETDSKIILALLITVIFSIPIFKEARKIIRLNRDLRSGIKTIFTKPIEDYRQNVRTDEQGNSSEYFLFFEGERYEVKGEHFFAFGRGDTVRVSAAPHSRYVFNVEKIAAAPRTPDGLFHFSSPLY